MKAYETGCPDRVQVGGVGSVLQVGQSLAQLIVSTLSAVVVPLHVQQVSDRVNGCQDKQLGALLLLHLQFVATSFTLSNISHSLSTVYHDDEHIIMSSPDMFPCQRLMKCPDNLHLMVTFR